MPPVWQVLAIDELFNPLPDSMPSPDRPNPTVAAICSLVTQRRLLFFTLRPPARPVIVPISHAAVRSAHIDRHKTLSRAHDEESRGFSPKFGDHRRTRVCLALFVMPLKRAIRKNQSWMCSEFYFAGVELQNIRANMLKCFCTEPFSADVVDQNASAALLNAQVPFIITFKSLAITAVDPVLRCQLFFGYWTFIWALVHLFSMMFLLITNETSMCAWWFSIMFTV